MARWSIVCVLAVVLQSSVVWRMSIFGARPELPLLLAVTAGVIIGARRGCMVGFWMGLLADALSGALFGLNAFTYSIVGYLAGVSDELLLSDDAPIRIAQIAATSALAIVIQAALGEVFGRPYMDGTRFLSVALMVGLLHAPLGLPAIRVIEWADPEDR